jgi:hypothetical protein
MSMGSISRTDTDIAGVKLTHPERILWAEPGITNQGTGRFLRRYCRLGFFHMSADGS